MISLQIALSKSALLLLASVVFFLAIVGVGLYTSRWIGHTDDYLVAGREVNWYVAGLTVAAVGWAGGLLAIFSIFALVFGFWAAFIPAAAIPAGYYLYGKFFVPFVRSVGTKSFGEFLELRFNVRTRIILGLYIGLSLAVFLAATSLGIGAILGGFVSWPIYPTAIAMILVVGAIVVSGGLWGSSVTSVIQAILGYTILPAAAVIFVLQRGGFNWIAANAPNGPATFAFPGGFGFGFGEASYLTWVLLWGIMLYFGAPHYWLMAIAPRSDSDAQRGYKLASVLTLLLAVILSVIPLYAYSINPGAFVLQGGSIPPEGAIGVAATALPFSVGLVLMVSAIAANVSSFTMSSMGAIAALSNDVYQRLFRSDATREEMLVPTRIISVGYFLLSIALLYFQDIQGLIGMLLTFIGISTIITLAGAYVPSVTSKAATTAALTGGIVAFAWPIFGINSSVHPIHPTIVAVVVPLAVVSLVTNPKYYARPDWTPPTADGGTVTRDALSEEEMSVLEWIGGGATRLGDIIEAMGQDGSQINETVENLEKSGLLTRRGTRGSDLYTLDLTERGTELLAESDHKLVAHNEGWITETAIQALSVLADGDDRLQTEDIASALDESEGDVIPHLNILQRRGYVTSSGAFRAKFEISSAGRTILSDYDI